MGTPEPEKVKRSPWKALSEGPFSLALALLMVLVAGIPLAIVSALSLNLTRGIMHDSVNAEVATLRNASETAARSFLDDQESLVQVVAAAPLLLAPRLEPKKRLIETYHRVHPAFHWLGFADPQGNLLVSSTGESRSLAPSMTEVLRAGRKGLYVSDARSAHDDPSLPVLLYGAPVLAPEGRLIGVLLVEVDLHVLIDQLKQLRIRRSGETYLIRGDGMLITSSRFLPQAELRQRIESEGFQEGRSGRQDIAEFVDYRGVQVIGAFGSLRVSRTVPGAPSWAILSEIDLAEAMAPVRHAEVTIALVFLVLFGLVAMVTATISRQVRAPLQSLQAAANAISHGRWDQRTNEDFPFELGQLASAFNRMAAQVESAITQLKAQHEASLDGILVVDEHQRILSYNRRLLAILGAPENEVLSDADAMFAKYALPLLKDSQQVIARIRYLNEHPLESCLDEIELTDGRVLEQFAAPVIAPDGTVFGRIWRFHDLTERRVLETQLRQQYARLLQLDQLKNDFVNAVSHDLRTPLTSVIGYAEFLEDGLAGSLTDQQMAYVHQIQKSGRRLEVLVNDLLDFARIEAGTFQLSTTETSLIHTLRDVAESMRPQIEEAGLNLEFCLPSEAPAVRADVERIERVLANLLSNAVKFTPPGGTIRVMAHVEDGYFVSEIADSGIGLAPEDIPRLFRRFSQLDSGRKHKGGTGLGLSISKSIVEAHKGSIGVRSVPGKGSNFWFTLPLAGA